MKHRPAQRLEFALARKKQPRRTAERRPHGRRAVRLSLLGCFALAAFVCRVVAAGRAQEPSTSGAATPGRNQAPSPASSASQIAAPQPLPPQSRGKLPITELNEDEAIVHALNRLGYGPQPGEVEQVKRMGLAKWIEQQLHPDKIDDAALQARLAGLPAPRLTAQNLFVQYPQPDAAAKRLGITAEEYRKRINDAAHPPQGVRPVRSVLPQEVLSELQQAKVLRAIYSQRQLEEQLTDFWLNHFNIFANKDLDLYYLGPFERDVIRPRVLGHFRDLLEATAKSPAMLFYLDNYLSADPQAFDRIRRDPRKYRAKRGAPPLGGRRGLNENYGRELMELHTIGVDGGYTQADVTEVARAFTGWTIASPRQKPEFYFDDRIHDPNPKRILGKTIHAGGIRDGEQVLDMLAKNPHTAQHIALELAQHFVSDTPPASLVERMAKTFRSSNGDLREVMRTMIYSPEFWSRAAYRAKVKRPFELVVSTARALDADVDDATPLVNWIGRIGEPLYQCVPPTGYSDKAEAWVNSGALLNRLNFALALAGNQVRGTQVQLGPLLGDDAAADPYQALDAAIGTFLAGQVSEATRSTLEKESADPRVARVRVSADGARTAQVNLGLVTGLVLGAPEFQQR